MLNRRQFVSSAVWLCLPGSLVRADTVQTTATAFSFDTVIDKARRLADADFVDPHGTLPSAWTDISYDQHRQIRFKPDHALWRGKSLFELQFFHPGFYFDYPVAINVVDDGTVAPVPFSPELFDYGELDPGQLGTDGLGFSGFRIHYPLNSARYADEFAVFLGASYFRIIGRDQQYGLSARGLAIDTASSDGEEFPLFREFWVEKPTPEATDITVYALLDSASLSGAYRFVLRPRTATQVEVKSVLFPRRSVDKLGIAPLTSMFFYGESQHRVHDDFRPEVHDSDGLQIAIGNGEWVWRPLVNRRQLNISAFRADSPRGFGLFQRDRDFQNYQDLEANYQRRPSLWVQPLGDWGPGRVELVEIPSDEEINDNIVSYWVADQPVEAGQPIELAYLLNAFLDNPDWPPGGCVEATRIGTATRPGTDDRQPAEARLFVIDFNRGDLPHIQGNQPVEGIVSTSSGTISTPVTQKNTVTGGWRLFFDLIPDGDNPADLRCFLKLRGLVLTETWSYLWKP